MLSEETVRIHTREGGNQIFIVLYSTQLCAVRRDETNVKYLKKDCLNLYRKRKTKFIVYEKATSCIAIEN